jgi:hypothetical protein
MEDPPKGLAASANQYPWSPQELSALPNGLTPLGHPGALSFPCTRFARARVPPQRKPVFVKSVSAVEARARLAGRVFEFRADGAVLRPCQAQRQRLRDVAARAAAPPLGMDDTFIVARPFAVRVAEGHFSNSGPTGPWDVRVDLAGAGGVRATLPDMVRYLEGQLGMRDSFNHAGLGANARTNRR